MTLPLETITEGKYEILGKIAAGGVGSIYKVRHRLLDEIRVIKVLRREHSAREEVQRRFLHEARAATRLKHPNIAQIYDFAVSEDGTAYIVMEYIDGVGLDRVLSYCGPPSLHLSLELAHQTLQALAYLHRQGFVHRDLSPDNLMLTRSHDDRPWIKMIDLGIVKNLGATSQVTVAGMFLGKARYSSPEQFSASSESAPINHCSDAYSFGVVLYQLLTGVCPIRGEAFRELAAAHLFHPPIPFSESDPEERVPPPLRDLLLRALAKDPAARPTVLELTLGVDELRQPGRVSENEFREIFVTAFSGAPRPQPADGEGTTQGRVDREFGIDRTTASGTTSGIDLSAEREVEPQAPPPPNPSAGAADASAPAGDPLATRPVELPAAPEPGTAAEPAAAPLASEVRRTPEPTGRMARAEAARPAADEAPVEAVPPAVEPPPSAATRQGLSVAPIAVIVALFLATAVGGYLWFRPSAPEPQTLRVEPTPTIRDQTTAAEEAGVLAPGAGVTPPQVLRAEAATYPPEARRRAVRATVVVAVLVDETGAVTETRLVAGDDSGLGLNEAATEAARRTTFLPATRDGEPGKMWARLRFEFAP